MNKDLTTGEFIGEVDSLLIRKKQLEDEIKSIEQKLVELSKRYHLIISLE